MYVFVKAKRDGSEKVGEEQCAPAPVPSINADCQGKAPSWAPAHFRGRADPNLNAVKIEKLSDDEEVDITDEMEELLSEQEPTEREPFDIPKSPPAQNVQTAPISDSSGHTFTVLLSRKDTPKPEESTGGTPETTVSCSEKNGHEPVKSKTPEYDGIGASDGTDWFSSLELCEEQRDFPENSILFHPSGQLDEENQMEGEELKPPDQEVEIDRTVISEEEKQAIPEFFVGRQAKTPERYLKIRNYILDQW